MSGVTHGNKAPPPTALQFVSITHPDEIKDRRNKRTIRRHVMKDIGVSRRKVPPSVTLTVMLPPPSEADLDSKVLCISQSQYGQTCSQIRLGPSDPKADLTLFSELDARVGTMKDFLLRRSSPICHIVRELCFTLAIIDDGAMHLALAESALHHQTLEEETGVLLENATALKHYNSSLRHINHKIQTVSLNMCYGLLSTVIGLASYDLAIGNVDRWETHMAGLETMIHVRGGVKSIESDYLLKAVLWVDIHGSLSLDRAPRFKLPIDTLVPIAEEASPVLAKIREALALRFPRPPQIYRVLESLAAVSTANTLECKADHKSPMGPSYRLYLARASYILLRLPRDDPAQATGVSEPLLLQATRLAALIYLSTLAETIPGSCSVEQYRLGLSTLLAPQDINWSGLEELELWVSVISLIGGEGKDSELTLMTRLSQLMKALDLDWEGVGLVIREISWRDTELAEQTNRLGEKLLEYDDMVFLATT